MLYFLNLMQISQFLINSTYCYFMKYARRFRNLNFYASHFCTSKIMATRNTNPKPPNVFVFTGKDCPKLFSRIEEDLYRCLQIDSYLVYHLLPSEVNKQPWKENTLLLILSCDAIDDSFLSTFENYVKHFGNILLICSKFNSTIAGSKCLVYSNNNETLIKINFKDVGETFMYRGAYSYFSSASTTLYEDCNNKPVIHKVKFQNRTLVITEVYLDRDPGTSFDNPMLLKYSKQNRLHILKCIFAEEFGMKVRNDDLHTPELTAGYFFTNNYDDLPDILRLSLGNIASAKSIFCQCTLKHKDSEAKLPVYYCNESSFEICNFNPNIYFANLTSKIYGRYVIYFPVITSTMDVAEQLSEYEGIVIVADYQISGQGRRSNKWISPVGCAMFTLHFTLSLSSPLGKKLPLLQHIASLAVVHGIKSRKIYKALDIRIKWPNDIYYDKTKIGGLIVKSTIINNLVHVNIGWGINVANEHPTFCLNNIIDKFNAENSSTLPYLCIEEVVASTVSQMEYFVQDFTNVGCDKFLSYYYLYWMHGNQKVTLENLNEKGIIKGLDEYGFLVVKTDNGKVLSLQPDGNRFDIMKNLIYSN